MQCNRGYRPFAYASSGIACSLNLAVLLLIQLLPKATSQVSQHVSLYAGFSALMGLAGLYGAHRRDPTWTSIFANYLLLDAIVFTVPRILLIAYAATIPYNLCSHTYSAVPATQIALRSSLAYPEFQTGKIEGVEQWAGRVVGQGHGQCVAISWIAICFSAIAVLVLTVGQWVAAVKVRRWARQLVLESERLPEKAHVDITCRRDRHVRFATVSHAV